MIYATLRPIRQWYNGRVLPNLLLLALYTGAAWLAAATALAEAGAAAGGGGASAARWLAAIAVMFAIAAVAAKLAYWRFIDTAPSAATIETATGLGTLGRVRSLEAPHTEENYLLREMGYAIARKHATRLRQIALALGCIIPALLLVAGAIAAGTVAAILFPLAAIAALLGVYLERWLFFAEATHTVTLYYGRRDEPPGRAAA
jgi:DMSO reductase anchor subunit